MIHKSDIVGLPLLHLVARVVSCGIRQGHGTEELLEPVAGNAGNNTPGVEDINLWVSLIESLCSVYFQYYYLMLPHCEQGVGVSQTGDQVEPYWLSSGEIRSSTLYVNKRWW